MSPCPIPPKPASRPEKTSRLRQILLFRRDIFTSQPERLYRAKMAEFKTLFFHSYLINQPDLIHTVLKERPEDFPKSGVISSSLKDLLGNAVFVTNGATWKRQRRMIDPAFEGGRLRETFDAMVAAGETAIARINISNTPEPIEIEEETSHLAADVIFRTLFSLPITHRDANAVFQEFRAYQRSQPLLNLASFLPVPGWMPRIFNREAGRSARRIRALLSALTEARAIEISRGSAPDDLATKIMTTRDPASGTCFEAAEMVDQVAIFFLAGHETSASALAWALYLLASDPDTQLRAAREAQRVLGTGRPRFSDVRRLGFIRDVWRETLRLYPPVPMMLRETTRPERFRNRAIRRGAQIVISPWHLHRHPDLWHRPDHFDPGRWQRDEARENASTAWIPFSTGPRVCTGAGFAMVEGVLLLAMLLRAFEFRAVPGQVPVPVAHLTVRARDGIHLKIRPRGADTGT